MSKTRTENTAYTISFGIIQRVSSIITGLLFQYAFLHYFGFNYAGLDGLFNSILVYLSLLELGLGTAISSRLYKSLAEKDTEKVKSIIVFLRRTYQLIGTIMFVCGLLVLPFLDKIIVFDKSYNINYNFLYILIIINSCLPYWFYNHKTILLEADQKSYISYSYGIFLEVGISLIKLLIIIVTKNYSYAILGEMAIRVIYSLLISKKINKLYPYLNNKNHKEIDNDFKNDLKTDVKALFIGNTSNALMCATDNIVISTFIGTAIIGHTYVYSKIISHVVILVGIFTTSISGSIGNLIYENKQIDNNKNVYNELSFINFCLSCFCSVCLFVLLNPFVSFFYGDNQELLSNILDIELVFLIVIHFYFQTINNTNSSYRKAFGIVKQGWLINLIGGFLHIILDIILAKKYGLYGIYISIIISDICITYIPNIYYLFKYGFKNSMNHELFKSFTRFIVLVSIMLLAYFICNFINLKGFIGIIFYLFICAVITISILFLLYKNKPFSSSILNRIKFLIKK